MELFKNKNYIKIIYIVIGICLVQILVGIVYLNMNGDIFSVDNEENFNIYYEIFMACSVGPILEELFFRKLIFMKLLRKAEYSNLIQALIFAFAHVDILKFVSTFVTGLIFGNAYRNNKKIYYPIFLHCIFNILSTFIIGVWILTKPIYCFVEYLPFAIFAISSFATIFMIKRNPQLNLFSF